MPMSKTTNARRDEISKMVLSECEVKVKDLARIFHVSMETIRKDLNYLDELGMVNKTHGGASVMNEYFQLPVNVKLQENVDIKRSIARRALDLIEDNSVVFMDAGSTMIQLAKLLSIKKRLTIITNSIVVANIALESNQNVICTGGVAQKRGKCLVGCFATDVIDSIHIDTMITGSDGFKGMDGPTTFSLEEADIRKHVIKNSERKILICDASKFSKTSTYQFAKFEEYDYFVTNESDELDQKILNRVKHVIIV